MERVPVLPHHREAQGSQVPPHRFGGDGHAEDVFDAADPEGDRPRFEGPRADVEHRTLQCAPRRGHDDGHGPLQGRAETLRVHAALETIRCVGGQGQLPARRPDGPGFEERALQEHVHGVRRDLGLLPTHDAGDGHGTTRVADQKHVGREPAFLAVEGGELLFFGRRPAHHDGGTVQPGQVEGVERLAQLQEHIVRGVHHVVDGPGSRAPQTLLEPRRRGADLHAPDHRAEIARTELRRLDADRHASGADLPSILHVFQGEVGIARDFGKRHRARALGGQLPGDAQVAQQVATVGGRLHFERDVVEAHGLHERLARREIAVDLEDAGVVRPQAQLFRRAEHALGVLPPDLGLLELEAAWECGARRGEGIPGSRLHVGGAAHDLEDAVSRVHRAQREAVGVGVLARGDDTSHDHVAQLRAGRHHLLHRSPPQGQVLGDLVRGERQPRDHGLQPTIGDVHGANRARKRTSFSKKVRRSSTPYLSFAMRAGPMPKAKPV